MWQAAGVVMISKPIPATVRQRYLSGEGSAGAHPFPSSTRSDFNSKRFEIGCLKLFRGAGGPIGNDLVGQYYDAAVKVQFTHHQFGAAVGVMVYPSPGSATENFMDAR